MAGLSQLETPGMPKDGKIHRSQILTRALNKVIGYEARPGTPEWFYPSSLGNKCDRALWFDYWGKLPNGDSIPSGGVSADLAKIFSTGNSFEDRFIKYLKKAELYVADEVSFRSVAPIPISGRIDFVIRFKDEDWVVELKTINDRGFDRLNKPKPEHIVQVQSYLNCSEFEQGFIVYENKDNQKWKEFKIEQDREMWAEIVARCQVIMNTPELPDYWKCTGPPWCICKELKI